MSKSPIELMLDGVEWIPAPEREHVDGGLPYATHSGVLEIMGHRFRCHRLSTGQAVFDADDVESFLEGIL